MNNYVLENKSRISKDWKAEKLNYCSFKHLLVYTSDGEESGMVSIGVLRHQSWGQIGSSFLKGCLGEADSLIPKQNVVQVAMDPPSMPAEASMCSNLNRERSALGMGTKPSRLL